MIVKPARVLFIERRLTHYRVPLLECLREKLGKVGVELRFVHGQPTPSELKKGDEGYLPWAERVTNRYWRVGSKDMCWQVLPKDANAADLVILNQENSLLSNYPFLLTGGRRPQRSAFFGHGANLQSDRPNGLRERFKRWTTNRVDWWFAYTSTSADLVASCGFPRERITNVENAVDTAAMHADIASITADERTELRHGLDLEGKRVALYLGSFYAEKRLDILIEAADRLYAKESAFRLLIVGDGPQREAIVSACKARPWCTWVGAKTGRDKALYLSVADLILNPGVVGLGILDSFTAGVPMVTTDLSGHGPEIAYLRPNENGLKTPCNVADFSEAAFGLLSDERRRSKLGLACQEAAEHYTLENMAQRFSDGIVSCLKASTGNPL